MIFIGVDPDVHATAVAAVNGEGHVVGIAVFKVPDKYKGMDAVRYACASVSKQVDPLIRQFAGDGVAVAAVEDQEIAHSSREGVNPRSMIPLAQAAGAFLMALHVGNSIAKAYCPKPQAWKGSVPKAIHQARICSRLGWKYEQITAQGGYCRPTIGLTPEQTTMIAEVEKVHGRAVWKHLLDGIGLALWAKDAHAKDAHKEATLKQVKGFSLIELLVVVLIITVLISILLPTLRYARSAGRDARCQVQVRNVATAYVEYVQTFRCLPNFPATDIERQDRTWQLIQCPEVSTSYMTLGAPWGQGSSPAYIRTVLDGQVVLAGDPGAFHFGYRNGATATNFVRTH